MNLDILILVAIVFLVSTITCSAMMIAGKYRLDQKYEEWKPNWMPFICYYCVGFWIAVLVTLFLNWYFNLNLNFVEGGIVSVSSAAVVLKINSNVIV